MASPYERVLVELAIREIFDDLSQPDKEAVARLVAAYPKPVKFDGAQYSIEDFTGQSKILRDGEVVLEVGFPLDDIKPKPRSYGLIFDW